MQVNAVSLPTSSFYSPQMYLPTESTSSICLQSKASIRISEVPQFLGAQYGIF